MCINCQQRYGFDLGHGCSANMAEAANRYRKLDFTWEDVDALMDSPPDEPTLTGIAARIAALLPPRQP